MLNLLPGSEFNWDGATVETRNEACGQFMPPSEVNPMRSYLVSAPTRRPVKLALHSREEAEAWLRIAAGSEETWKRVMPEWPAPLRKMAKIEEQHYYPRYTDTPGGAWVLVEELVNRNLTVESRVDAHRVWLKVLWPHGRDLAVEGIGRPFECLMGIAWLAANGIEVQTEAKVIYF